MNLLSFAEMRSLYKWNAWMRPVLTYTLMTILSIVTLTICFMLITKSTTITESSGILITIAGGIVPILAAIVVGRSYERSKGIKDSAVEQLEEEERSNPPLPAFGTGNPFADLNSLDLDEYMPRVADDNPRI